ncbi:MAG: deoxyribodipyrimidine photo-lyase [bacterium]|nr:deoxyribodipyrimidine photo-lyase [bacterium]
MASGDPVSLHWFTSDLRLDDNPALAAAAGAVAGAFVLVPAVLARHAAARRRIAFLHATLRALDAALRARGTRLVVLEGDPAAVLPPLAARLGATVLTYAASHEPAARARAGRVARALERDGVTVRAAEAALVQPAGSVRSGAAARIASTRRSRAPGPSCPCRRRCGHRRAGCPRRRSVGSVATCPSPPPRSCSRPPVKRRRASASPTSSRTRWRPIPRRATSRRWMRPRTSRRICAGGRWAAPRRCAAPAPRRRAIPPAPPAYACGCASSPGATSSPTSCTPSRASSTRRCARSRSAGAATRRRCAAGARGRRASRSSTPACAS